jgi:membrane associated rhomboid family serine protease
MGLYDREYYRDDYSRREFWQIGAVTLTLIGVIVALFFVQLVTIDFEQYANWIDPLMYWGGFSHEKILDGQVWRLLTSLFLHHPYNSVWLMVAGIVILAYCGRSVEGTYGPKEMFWYYVFTGLVTQLALLAVCILRPFHFLPPEPGYGSGGPVAAVMVLFALMAPNAKVPVVFYSVRAGTLATIIIIGNLLLFASSQFRYFTAIPVLCGAAFAFAYYQYNWRVSNWIPDFPGLRGIPMRGPKKSQPLFRSSEPDTPQLPMRADHQPSAPVDPVSAPATVLGPVDEQLEAQVDRVLAKVGKFGKQSLTAEEQAVLQKASELYKNRRK